MPWTSQGGGGGGSGGPWGGGGNSGGRGPGGQGPWNRGPQTPDLEELLRRGQERFRRVFQGGPGATGRSFSDFPTIIASIKAKLLDLPGETTVYTGHGPTTTIGAERPHLEEWIARGH